MLATHSLKENGVGLIHVLISHGLFVETNFTALASLPIERLVVTNTIPQKRLFCTEPSINGDVPIPNGGAYFHRSDADALETTSSTFSHSTFANGELSTSRTNSPESSTPSSPRLFKDDDIKEHDRRKYP
ncbi:hypothetical protein JB92DRAFT_3144440 [Gautieria morchelliformis]|nr:hypothetical protein JB92DRAFT_3144440 [Gautieria morchelliformis]